MSEKGLSAFFYVARNRDFLLLWLAQAASTMGDFLVEVVAVWDLLGRTEDLGLAGLAALLMLVGRLLGSAAAGAFFLDRLPERRVMLVASFFRFILMLNFSFLWLIRAPRPDALYIAIIFLVSILSAFFNPARLAAVPRVVPGGRLLSANVWDSLWGPIVPRIAWWGSGILLLFFLHPTERTVFMSAGFFLLSFILVLWAVWKRPVPPSARAQERWYQGVFGGVRWARRDSVGANILVTEALLAVPLGLILSALPYRSLEYYTYPAPLDLQGGVPWELSPLLAALLAALYINRTNPRRLGLLYVAGILAGAAGSALVGFSPHPIGFLAGLFLAGVGYTGWIGGRQAILQARVPAEVRGRTFALLDTATITLLLPTWFLGVWAANGLGTRPVMMAAALFQLLIGLYLRRVRPIRHYEIEPETRALPSA